MFEDIQTMNCAHNNIRVHDIIIIIIICSLAPREKYKGEGCNSRTLTWNIIIWLCISARNKHM